MTYCSCRFWGTGTVFCGNYWHFWTGRRLEPATQIHLLPRHQGHSGLASLHFFLIFLFIQGSAGSWGFISWGCNKDLNNKTWLNCDFRLKAYYCCQFCLLLCPDIRREYSTSNRIYCRSASLSRIKCRPFALGLTYLLHRISLWFSPN